MEIIHANADSFDSVIKDNTAVLVDFWATWCGPCKMVSPIMEQLAQEFSDKLVVAKVNVDEEPELTERFGIQSIPTVIFLKNGEPVLTEVGARSLEHYQQILTENL
ncbi:MAG TPA: thioredoxin [Oscillospiraceae bacterium]|nr:thioredoxin [Oscillospiraceae bacterium]